MENESKIEKYDYEIFYKSLMHTTALIEKISKETDRKFQETNLKFQQSERMLTEKFQATDKELHELIRYTKEQDAKSIEQDKKVRDLNNLFVNQWGYLVESLVEGKIVELLNERGIKVQHTATNLKSFKDEAEIDIIAENGNEIVVIEVKTTLRNDYIDEFLEKLTNFKKFFPKYRENIVYGAMAYLKSPENVAARGKKQGLLLIKATGDRAFITNSVDFKPKTW
jgi:Holliday junction resolvase-like predicted endonuclease